MATRTRLARTIALKGMEATTVIIATTLTTWARIMVITATMAITSIMQDTARRGMETQAAERERYEQY